MVTRARWMIMVLAATTLAAILLVGCGKDESGRIPLAASARAPNDPVHNALAMAGGQQFTEMTAGWSAETLEACGSTLRDALGTRDLVENAVNGMQDPERRAASELADARNALAEGSEKLDEVRSKLEAGTCDQDVRMTLGDATAAFFVAGRAAVRASQLIKGG